MGEHTKRRLDLGPNYTDTQIKSNRYLLITPTDVAFSAGIVAEVPNLDNARRLVACWNACEGIQTEHVEQMIFFRTLRENAHSYAELERDRDELLAALLELEQAYTNKHSPQHRASALGRARSILAKHPSGGAK